MNGLIVLFFFVALIGAIFQIFCANVRFICFLKGDDVSLYAGSDYKNQNPIVEFIKFRIERQRALKTAEKYLDNIDKNKKTFRLSNDYCSITYNTKDISFTALDKRCDVNNRKYGIKIQAFNKKEAQLYFNSLCFMFNEATSVQNIEDSIKILGFRIDPFFIDAPVKKELPKPEAQTVQQIDINSATEEELSKLNGISLILAKKIVKRINEKGAFIKVEDFFKEFKIKKVHQEQLANILIAKEPKKIIKKEINNERIVDI